MATFELSQGFYDGNFKSNLITGTYRTPAYSGSGIVTWVVPYSEGGPNMALMKGAVPTSFSGTLWNARSSDTLVEWYLRLGSGTGGMAVNITNNPFVITSQYSNAIASGTATWFIVNGIYQTWNGPLAIDQQFIGTVGTVGAGTDLEMINTSITSGNPYKVQSISIQIPLTYTY